MADKIGVMNSALGFLGERPITNPDAPETQAGKHIADRFDQCRREILRRYAWNFAEVWKAVEKTTAPPFGYDDAYAMPADCMRLLWVGDIKCTRRDFRLISQGAPDYRRVIALDNGGASTLNIAYSADISILPLWDPLALKVFSLWLALDAAKAVTGQDAQVALINQLLSDELKDAVAVDGQEQRIQQHNFSEVQQARSFSEFGTDESFFTNVVGYQG